MGGPKKPRFDTTVSDPRLTATLASRVRRDVALEKATEEVHEGNDESVGPIPVSVVLGPDGVPQVVEEVEPSVATRIDPSEHAKKRRK
jgi:hypothetical protein